MKFLLAASLLMFASVLNADELQLTEGKGQGIIHAVDFAENRMIVQGVGYTVAPDFEVEIGGSYGAFTMLEPGMRVDFVYHRYPNGDRQMISLRELGGSESVFEH
ncbi:MAG: hypothetical protein AAF529_10010 [Pseudomonadota bacterium]